MRWTDEWRSWDDAPAQPPSVPTPEIETTTADGHRVVRETGTRNYLAVDPDELRELEDRPR